MSQATSAVPGPWFFNGWLVPLGLPGTLSLAKPSVLSPSTTNDAFADVFPGVDRGGTASLADGIWSTTGLDFGLCDMTNGGSVVKRAHCDLSSFIRHSIAKRLDQTTAVFRGTLFEYATREALLLKYHKRGLQTLENVGGGGDRGIDLVGAWQGRQGEPLHVIVQCKSSSSKVPPKNWRELAGTARQGMPESTLAILASPQPMSTASLAAFMKLDAPLMHCLIDPPRLVYDETKKRQDCVISKNTVIGLTANSRASNLLKLAGINWSGSPAASPKL